METSKYITITKQSPVFSAWCDAFGTIEIRFYKDWCVGNDVGSTFALDFKSAVNRLHEWIEDNAEFVRENPRCWFHIEVLDGSVDKYNEVKRTNVYSISARKAIKYLNV